MTRSIGDIASSGINISEQQLKNAGQNIANVDSKEYKKQVIEQSATTDSKGITSGVNLFAVKRMYDKFAESELRYNSSDLGRSNAGLKSLQDTDNLIANAGNLVTKALNGFFKATAELSDNPTNLGYRNSVLVNARNLAAAVQSFKADLTDKYNLLDEEIEDSLQEVNKITASLAALKLSSSSNADLDRKDKLLADLSRIVKIHVVENKGSSPNSFNLLLNEGNLLYFNSKSFKLGTKQGVTVDGDKHITLAGKPINIKNFGGKLQGLLDIKDNIISPLLKNLDLFALGATSAINEIHRQSFGLDGSTGNLLFNDLSTIDAVANRAFNYKSNTSSARINKITVTDHTKINNDYYELKVVDAKEEKFMLSARDKGVSLMFSGRESLDQTERFGFKIIFKNDDYNSLKDNDKFLIKPIAGSAGNIKVKLDDLAKLAVGSFMDIKSDKPKEKLYVQQVDRSGKDFADLVPNGTKFKLTAVADSNFSGDVTHLKLTAIKPNGSKITDMIRIEEANGFGQYQSEKFGITFALNKPITLNSEFNFKVDFGRGSTLLTKYIVMYLCRKLSFLPPRRT